MIETFTVVIVFSFVVLSIGIIFATWKLFQYRNRLQAFIDNDRWEKTLYSKKIYNDNLIVFFGDSQIGLWGMASSFGLLPIVNKGVYGDWALKAISRFDRDVLSLNPKLLVMLIGTNDLGNGQTIESIIKNIQIMLDKAASQDIKIILCSLLPVSGKYISDRSLKDILQINNEFQHLSEKYDADYVDFHSQMVDLNGLFTSEFTSDGLHPSRSGYMKMTKIILPYLVKYSDKFTN